jgi:hypothetical protein
MPLIASLIVLVVAAVAVSSVVIIVIVISGIRREERDLTMTRRRAPSPAAWLTRRIVGLYVRKTDPCDPCADDDQSARWYQNSR